MSPPRPGRSWSLPRPGRLDVSIALAFLLLVVAEAALSPDVPSPLLHVTVAGAAMAALAYRRRAPLVVAAVVAVANFGLNPEGQFSTLLSLVLVTFTVGAETDPPRSYYGLGIVLLPFVALLTYEGLEPSDLAAALVFLIGPWGVGSATRQRTRRTEQAVARAEQLERDREREAEAAAAEERTRIARELHDIVSHSISVVTVQTQAVRRRLGPEQAREAADLEAVEAAAREAMVEMRRLFGLLRHHGDAPALAPQPGLGQLDSLLEQVRAAGLPVELTRRGDAYEPPAGIDLAAYRIIQEATTNALRHSGAGRVKVQVDHQPTHLGIVVEDDGRGMPGGPHHGHGLIGIRERVTVCGGTLSITRGRAGGTRIQVELPVRSAT